MEITKSEFVNWRDNKVTKEIFKLIRAKKTNAADYVAMGGTLTSQTERDTALFVGRISGYDELLNIQWDESEESEEEENHD